MSEHRLEPIRNARRLRPSSQSGEKKETLLTVQGRAAMRPENRKAGKLGRSPTKLCPSAVAFKQAVALHRRGRFAEAEKLYRQILETHPDRFDSLHLLGVVYGQLGKHAEAVRQIDAALKVNPRVAPALNNRGLALEKLERLDEALASYDQAIALKPDYAEAFKNRGNVLLRRKRLDEALASYDQAIAFETEYAEAFNNRGIALQ